MDNAASQMANRVDAILKSAGFDVEAMPMPQVGQDSKLTWDRECVTYDDAPVGAVRMGSYNGISCAIAFIRAGDTIITLVIKNQKDDNRVKDVLTHYGLVYIGCGFA